MKNRFYPRQSLKNSFRCAGEGISFCFRTQRNMKIHGLAAVVVLTAGTILGADQVQLIFLLVAITLVLAAEMVNTALEQVIDLASPTYHPLACSAKNIAAGVVLLSVLTAVVIGFMIFFSLLFSVRG